MHVIFRGDCLDSMRLLPDNSVDSIVTDPPYGLRFMGKRWDYDVPSVEIWAECLRVLKPGGHLLAFAGTRTQHRMAVRIEDAGFEVRDMIAWVYGSGFPKSLDVSKAIDKVDASAVRRERQLRFTAWVRGTGLTASEIDQLTGTNMGSHYVTAASQPAVATRALFERLRPYFDCEVPAWVEQLVDERTVESENFKRREVTGQRVTGIGTGGGATPIMGDGNRDITAAYTEDARQWQGWGTALKPALEPITVARKPLIGTVAANVLAHGTGVLNIDGCRIDAAGDDTARVTNGAICGGNFGAGGTASGPVGGGHPAGRWPANLIHDGSDEPVELLGDSARFFYCAKASRKDRNEGLDDPGPQFKRGTTLRQVENTDTKGNNHPTVKPTDLMRYLCRLVTPPGGTVLDPFMGSGSTGKAAVLEGFDFIGCELSDEYADIAQARIDKAANSGHHSPHLSEA